MTKRQRNLLVKIIAGAVLFALRKNGALQTIQNKRK